MNTDFVTLALNGGLHVSIRITRNLTVEWKFSDKGLAYTCIISTTQQDALKTLKRLSTRALKDDKDITLKELGNIKALCMVEGTAYTQHLPNICMRKYHELQVASLMKLYKMASNRIPSLH